MVLLIGGGSSAGKTTAATALATERGIERIDIGEIQRAIDGPWEPFVVDQGTWRSPATELCQRLVAKGRSTEPYLVRRIDELTFAGVGAIVEGEGVHPTAPARCARVDRVRAVFVIERDGDRLYATLDGRSKAWRSLGEPERWRLVETLQLYNEWLEGEARRWRQPVVASQPFATLVERIARVVGG